MDRNCIYELDSSTPQKFSRHLIVRIPGHAFAHNLAVGDFVNQVLAASGDDLTVDKAPAVTTPPLAGEGSITALPQAQQQAQPPQRTWFVDTAVYTRNRHFRLAYSCKGGKTAVLCPTQRFAAALGPNRPSPAKVFLDTLITNVDPAAKLLLVRSPREGLGHGGGRERGGVVTVPLDGHRLAWKVDNTDGPPGPQGDGKKEGEMDFEEEMNTSTCSLMCHVILRCSSWYPPHCSFFSALRKLAEAALPFIERVATQRAGQEARARTMAFCGFDGTVAYSMIGEHGQQFLCKQSNLGAYDGVFSCSYVTMCRAWKSLLREHWPSS